MANWSELPIDLLQVTSNLTNTSNTSNERHFRSVCSSWRTSVPLKPSTYFHSPIIKYFSSQAHLLEFRLVKQTTFLLCPSYDPNSCWVVKTEEHKPGVFHLLSPFSKCTYIKEVNCNILDLTNINTLELGHEYVLRNVSANNNNYDHLSVYGMEHEKVASNFIHGNDNFTLLSTHNVTGKLLMYRSKTQEWAVLDDLALGYDDGGEFLYNWSVRYTDVVEFEGEFYAVTDSGRTVIIEYSDEFFVGVNLMVKSIIGGDKKCLVKSNEDLLLVDLYTCSDEGSLEVDAIDVYKLDKKNKKWVLLMGLGGRVIFLSKNSSLCTYASLCGLKENCIYFSFKDVGKDYFEKKGRNIEDFYKDDGVRTNETEVFDYDKGKFGSFGEFGESKCFCWPPPTWINMLF